jgi:hypothetical protein
MHEEAVLNVSVHLVPLLQHDHMAGIGNELKLRSVDLVMQMLGVCGWRHHVIGLDWRQIS